MTADAAVTKVVDNILTVGSKDYDISKATIVDVTGNDDDINSASSLKDAENAKVMMIVNADDMTASYVYVTAYTAS